MQGLTKRQQMVLDFISKSIFDRGYPPTLREIGTHMGIRSTNGVNDHLKALERKGYLRREDMKSRALRPVEQGETGKPRGPVRLPIVGRVYPGQPVLSEENIEDHVVLDQYLVGQEQDLFILRSDDDGMKGAGIARGDMLVVKKQMHAAPHDIVVVCIDDGALVRYYHPERDAIHLRTANELFEDMVILRPSFTPTQLLGIVVGLYRRL